MSPGSEAPDPKRRRGRVSFAERVLAGLERRGEAAQPVTLTFVFTTQSQEAANRLADVLRDQVRYPIAVKNGASRFDPEWLVSGTTMPQPVTRSQVQQWEDWLRTIGAQYNCHLTWLSSGSGAG